MEKWTPSDEVKNLVIQYGGLIRKCPAATLWGMVDFYLQDMKGQRSGLTMFLRGKETVILDIIVPGWPIKFQAETIFHELYHVAQQLDWGWPQFCVTYAWQWLRCGFSYDRMKNMGIEKEAYDQEEFFKARLPK